MLGVIDVKIGNAIQEAVSINCACNVTVSTTIIRNYYNIKKF